MTQVWAGPAGLVTDTAHLMQLFPVEVQAYQIMLMQATASYHFHALVILKFQVVSAGQKHALTDRANSTLI